MIELEHCQKIKDRQKQKFIEGRLNKFLESNPKVA